MVGDPWMGRACGMPRRETMVRETFVTVTVPGASGTRLKVTSS